MISDVTADVQNYSKNLNARFVRAYNLIDSHIRKKLGLDDKTYATSYLSLYASATNRTAILTSVSFSSWLSHIALQLRQFLGFRLKLPRTVSTPVDSSALTYSLWRPTMLGSLEVK